MEIEYLSPDTDVRLESGRESPVFIEADTLDGFVGQWEDNPVTRVGVSGEAIDLRDRKILPTEGSFTLVVKSRDAWREARRAFSPSRDGTLIIRDEGESFLPVRLMESLPSPATLPTTGARIEVQLVSPQGAWRKHNDVQGPGEVVVTNYGDAPLWPSVRWRAASSVTLPSGVKVDLPKVDSLSMAHFDRGRAGLVFTVDGELTGGRVEPVAEQVPVGESRTFTVSDGAVLSWDVEVLDPWI